MCRSSIRLTLRPNILRILSARKPSSMQDSPANLPARLMVSLSFMSYFSHLAKGKFALELARLRDSSGPDYRPSGRNRHHFHSFPTLRTARFKAAFPATFGPLKGLVRGVSGSFKGGPSSSPPGGRRASFLPFIRYRSTQTTGQFLAGLQGLSLHVPHHPV
jgi:hypothetical protein